MMIQLWGISWDGFLVFYLSKMELVKGHYPLVNWHLILNQSAKCLPACSHSKQVAAKERLDWLAGATKFMASHKSVIEDHSFPFSCPSMVKICTLKLVTELWRRLFCQLTWMMLLWCFSVQWLSLFSVAYFWDNLWCCLNSMVVIWEQLITKDNLYILNNRSWKVYLNWTSLFFFYLVVFLGRLNENEPKRLKDWMQ